MPSKKEYTVPEIKLLLIEHNGSLEEVSRRYSICPATLCDMLDEHKDLQRAIDVSNNILIDRARQKMLELIDSEDANVSLKAASFVLSRLGKTKGWSSKDENVIDISPEIVINRIAPSPQ